MDICVFCRKHPVDPVWRPFCSQRCQIQDLARWGDGTYRVPGENATLEDDGDAEERQRAKGRSSK